MKYAIGVTKPIERGDKLYKYWCQRHNLFTRFDDGVLMDEEAWYSVTPEKIAKHIADKVHNSLGTLSPIIVDAFCGVGGNLIQFACVSPEVRVIGCDINPHRLRMAKHNAKLYGVAHQCEFILGDFMEIVKSIRCQRIDAIFLSPPWGGIDYQDATKYSLHSMTPNGYEIVHSCRKYITDNIAFLMPRNVDLQEVRDNLLDKSHPIFEMEKNMVGKKIKTITAYFGDLVSDDGSDSEAEQQQTKKSSTS